MQLDALLGNAQTTGSLKAALAAGTLAHAVLLAGPDGCGRNFAARCLAADYLYPAGAAPAQAVMQGESPEVLLVAGEGKSGQIPVDRIRAVRSDVFMSALSAAGRVVHIRDAHRMAAPAANALLKVLEEPPADVLFILTAHSASALPATITSRCVLYPLAPAPADACEARLADAQRQAGPEAATPAQLPMGLAPQALPQLLTVLYGGRIGLGLRALADPARLAVVMDALAAAKAAAARDTYSLMALFARYEGRADGDRERREALLADLANALDACLQGQALPGLPAVPPQVAALLLPPIFGARQALAGNTAPKLTFTALAVQLARVK